MTAWLFLAAYTFSGLAGLVYEVTWVRTLTLYMGHSTAATSTVVAAFMGGMAAGAAIGGRIASRMTPRAALIGYAVLEAVVVLLAIAMPFELRAVMPVLKWAYNDGTPGALFPTARLVLCVAVLIPPTAALGATFPFGVRWFVAASDRAGQFAGRLYAANTTGAAVGTLAAGFVLIPAIGVRGTTLVGVAASVLAIGAVLLIARIARTTEDRESAEHAQRRKKVRHKGHKEQMSLVDVRPRRWPAAVVLACTGFATFLYEITWSRVFATLIGPTTYAFAATVTGLIGGLAVGSAFGSVLVGRIRRPELPLALALIAAALAASWSSAYAGGLPVAFARDFAASAQSFDQQLFGHAVLAGALVAPAAVALGVAFPLALEMAGRNPAEAGSHEKHEQVAERLGTVYAVNTMASVAGSLTAGFLALPLLGFQNTLRLADSVLIGGAAIVLVASVLTLGARVIGLTAAVAAAGLVLASSPWDRALLASGGYKYAVHVPKGLDVPTALKAGTVLFYREGPTGIVSVKRLTGTLSLSIDGKVDASTGGDMLTQKTLAQLPLLLHGHARTVGIIGLGSGVTLASALTHPVESVDVVEISPEVVAASRLFAADNHNALDDPRTRLILGDGRSHLALSERQYDVIISEPSNPWMAGVAALFTRQFFEAARRRLAPGGIICQWAHTYDISDQDLRSIVATFASVFPNGTMWLVGDGDLLLVGSSDPLDERLANIQAGWNRAGVAADLGRASMRDPFSLLSLLVGGPKQVAAYGSGAALQTDDRMALEFSGPQAINNSGATAVNTTTLRQLQAAGDRPDLVSRILADAGAGEWRNRGAMMLAADAYEIAYQDYTNAARLDRTDATALAGLVRTAVASHHEAEAATLLKSLAGESSVPAPRIALSKLLAATGGFDEALNTARAAALAAPADPAALEQLASLYAERGDPVGLDPVVDTLQRLFPNRPMTSYYAAASSFLHERLPAALARAQEAVEKDPQHAASHNLLGAIHASLGQAAEARTAFQAALRLDARDSTTYTNLALLELSSGRSSQAADLFSEALSLDPSSEAARQGLARAAAIQAAR